MAPFSTRIEGIDDGDIILRSYCSSLIQLSVFSTFMSTEFFFLSCLLFLVRE